MADMKPRQGKPPLGLLPRTGLEIVAAAMEHGAGKYWPNNWRDCPRDEAFTYIHAILRHAVAMANGEEIDPESGIPHAGFVGAGTMIYCTIMGFEYREPNIMRDHPERKARINSLEAMFGPRPAALPVSVEEVKAFAANAIEGESKRA